MADKFDPVTQPGEHQIVSEDIHWPKARWTVEAVIEDDPPTKEVLITAHLLPDHQYIAAFLPDEALLLGRALVDAAETLMREAD